LRAVIPTVITQMLSKQDIKLGSTSPTRDFTFVEDTVSGMLSAINKKKSIGEIINIGSGYEISIKQLITVIEKISGQKINIKKETKRVRPLKSEVFRLVASIKKAKKILNWSPKYSGIKGLENGLRKTLDWFKKNKNSGNYKPDIYNY